MNEQTKPKLIWPALILSFLPVLFILHAPASFALKPVALYLSAIAGYAGVLLLLWMYILGAKSAMGLVFKDLAPVLEIHKCLGKYASIAFLLHPLFIIYSYGESLIYPLIPHIDTPFEQAVTLGRISFMIIAMIWIASVLLREKLGFRPWKYLHYFAYISLPFALLHVPNIGSQYIAWPLVRSYYFAIVGVFAVFSLIRVSSLLNLDRKPYVITSHQQLTPDDFVMTLKPISTYLEPKLGQYVYVKAGYISEDHPFSITYYNPETRELTLAYRVYGDFTKFLAKLQNGAEVQLGGPYGAFMRNLPSNDTKPVVYIAGGIGITPFVQRILDENNTREQWLFAANRTHASAVLVSDMQQQLSKRCVPIYSRETPLDGEEQGHVSAELLGKYLTTPANYTYYICGPKDFTAEAQRILAAMNVPNAQVHSEKFSW